MDCSKPARPASVQNYHFHCLTSQRYSRFNTVGPRLLGFSVLIRLFCDFATKISPWIKQKRCVLWKYTCRHAFISERLWWHSKWRPSCSQTQQRAEKTCKRGKQTVIFFQIPVYRFAFIFKEAASCFLWPRSRIKAAVGVDKQPRLVGMSGC